MLAAPKVLRWRIIVNLAVGACLLATGCGGAGRSAGPQEFVYTTTIQSVGPDGAHLSAVSGFRADNSGHLRPIAGSPFPISFQPGGVDALQTDPKSRFLLIEGGALGCMFCFGTTGVAALEPNHELSFPPSPFPNINRGISQPLIDALGRFVFYRDPVTAGGIHVAAVTADLSFPEVQGSPFVPGFMPDAVDPGGKFLVAIESNNASFAVFSIASSGTLTELSRVQNDDPRRLFFSRAFVHPSGKFLYMLVQDLAQQIHLELFQVDASGRLTATSFAPIIGGLQADVPFIDLIAIHPSGKFFYGFQCDPSQCRTTPPIRGGPTLLSAFAIDQATGEVNISPRFSLPQDWLTAVFDQSGERMFATRGADCLSPGQLIAVRVDKTTGRLMPGPATPTDTCPQGIAITQ